MVGSFTQKFSKNSGKQFGILQLEDLDSSAECMIYERALNTLFEFRNRDASRHAAAARSHGQQAGRGGEAAGDRRAGGAARRGAGGRWPRSCICNIYASEITSEKLKQVSEACFRAPGDTRVVVCLVGTDDSVTFIESRGRKISVTPELLRELDSILGPGHYRLKAKPYSPPPRRMWNRDQGGRGGAGQISCNPGRAYGAEFCRRASGASGGRGCAKG